MLAGRYAGQVWIYNLLTQTHKHTLTAESYKAIRFKLAPFGMRQGAHMAYIHTARVSGRKRLPFGGAPMEWRRCSSAMLNERILRDCPRMCVCELWVFLWSSAPFAVDTHSFTRTYYSIYIHPCMYVCSKLYYMFIATNATRDSSWCGVCCTFRIIAVCLLWSNIEPLRSRRQHNKFFTTLINAIFVCWINVCTWMMS